MNEYSQANFLLKCILLTVLFLILLIAGTMLFYFNRPLNIFRDLPSSSTNGTWAKSFLESNHSRNFINISEMYETSTLFARVEVLERRIDVLGYGSLDRFLFGDYIAIWEEFYIYTLKILEVYQNNLPYINNQPQTLKYGDTIEIFQYRRINNSLDLRFPFDLISSDINIGDDLVLFLVSNNNFVEHPNYHTGTRFTRLQHRRANTNGTITRRSPVQVNAVTSRIRGIPSISSLFVLTNQVQAAYRYNPYLDFFESVNPHNNLTLTRDDLF